MKKLYLFGFIVLVNLATIEQEIAQSGRKATVSSPSGLTTPPPNLPRPTIIRPSNVIENEYTPDYVVYETVFRLAKTGWSVAEELKFHPEEVRICRQYRLEKILNNKQEKVLNEVSVETLLELEKLDQKAKTIIDEFRAKMRSGMIIQGGERPMPPPELEELEQKKIKLIEGAIEKLKNRLGKKDFIGLNDFVNKNLRSGMKSGNVPTP